MLFFIEKIFFFYFADSVFFSSSEQILLCSKILKVDVRNIPYCKKKKNQHNC